MASFTLEADAEAAYLERITAHLQQKIRKAGGDALRGSLTLIPTNEGTHLLRSITGGAWFVRPSTALRVGASPV